MHLQTDIMFSLSIKEIIQKIHKNIYEITSNALT